LSDAPRGWNAIVQQAISPDDVEQLSSSEVRLTVYPAAMYAIEAPETVVVALDAALLSSQERIVASPSLRVKALAGTASRCSPAPRGSRRAPRPS